MILKSVLHTGQTETMGVPLSESNFGGGFLDEAGALEGGFDRFIQHLNAKGFGGGRHLLILNQTDEHLGAAFHVPVALDECVPYGGCVVEIETGLHLRGERSIGYRRG